MALALVSHAEQGHVLVEMIQQYLQTKVALAGTCISVKLDRVQPWLLFIYNPGKSNFSEAKKDVSTNMK